jgi:hypothetical protein
MTTPSLPTGKGPIAPLRSNGGGSRAYKLGVSGKTDTFREYGPVYTQCKGSAKERGKVFNLSRRQVAEIVRQGCYYCGRGPDKEQSRVRGAGGKRLVSGREVMKYSGIDRVDNAIGYELGNCVPCCSVCNRMKRDLSLEDFFTQVSRIYHFSIHHEGESNE